MCIYNKSNKVVRWESLGVYDPLPSDDKIISYRAIGKIITGICLCVMYLCSIYLIAYNVNFHSFCNLVFSQVHANITVVYFMTNMQHNFLPPWDRIKHLCWILKVVYHCIILSFKIWYTISLTKWQSWSATWSWHLFLCRQQWMGKVPITVAGRNALPTRLPLLS